MAIEAHPRQLLNLEETITIFKVEMVLLARRMKSARAAIDAFASAVNEAKRDGYFDAEDDV